MKRRDTSTANPIAEAAGTGDLLALTGQASYEWDIQSDALRWGPGFARLIGFKPEVELARGRDFESVVTADSGQSRYGVVLSAEAGKHRPGEAVPYRCNYAIAAERLESGEAVWIEDSGAWYPDEHGRPLFAHGVVRVVNERRKREDKLRRRSDHDELTGLPNRRYLEFRLGEAIRETQRDDSRAALLLIGIERLDRVNDFYGFPAGDDLMRVAGKAIAERLRADDLVARFSGAKFGVLLRNCTGPEAGAASGRFLDLLCDDPLETPAGRFQLSAAIGACQIPRHATNAREAIAGAFIAFRHARMDAGERFRIYEPDGADRGRRADEAALASNLLARLDAGRGRLALQPVIEAASGRVAWRHAALGVEGDGGDPGQPEAVRRLAASLGFESLVDRHTIAIALETLAKFPETNLSVELSKASARDARRIARLAERLQLSPLAARRLTIDLAGDASEGRDDAVAGNLQMLRVAGCRIIAPASLDALFDPRGFPFDAASIDVRLSSEEPDRKYRLRALRLLVEVAKSRGLGVLARQVDNAETATMLSGWGVDYLQGACFGLASAIGPWRADDPDGAATHVAGTH